MKIAAYANVRPPELRRLTTEQLARVVSATRLGMINNVVNGSIVALAIRNHVSETFLLIWLALIYGSAAYVALKNDTMRKWSVRPLSSRAMRLSIVTAVLGGLPWGMISFLIPASPDQLIPTSIVIAVVAGMTAGGAIQLAPVYPAAFAYIATILVPTVYFMLAAGGEQNYLLAALTVSFATFLLILVNTICRISVEATENNDQRKAMLVEIESVTREIQHVLSNMRPSENNDSKVRDTLKIAQPAADMSLTHESAIESADAIVGTLRRSAIELIEQEKALDRSESRLRSLMNSANDAIIGFGGDGKVVLYNAAAEKILGMPQAQAYGQSMNEFIEMALEADAMSALAKELKQPHSDTLAGHVVKSLIKHRDGREIPVEASLSTTGSGSNSTTLLIIRDITERRRWEQHLMILMREVCHRSKNLLAVISSISHCTASHSENLKDFSVRFTSRLGSLSKAHDIVAKDNWTESDIRHLIASQLGAALAKGSHIYISGPKVYLKPRATQNLGLALHELYLNATTHGALTVPQGRVDFRWRLVEDEHETHLVFVWRETGGPAVKAPTITGFGTLLLERILGAELGGRSRLQYRKDGVVWQAVIGAPYFTADGARKTSRSQNPFEEEYRMMLEYDAMLPPAA